MKGGILKGVLFLAVWMVLAAGPASAGSFLYVSLAGQNRIAVYRLKPDSGGLQHCTDVKVSGSPGALAVDPQRRWLFAALRSTSSLAAFQLEAKTGNLSLINEVSAGANPAYVATDRNGRYLLSAYYGAGQVAVHRIGKNGSLGEEPLQTIETAPKAHAIRTDPSNRFAFVPHTGPNAIFQFLIDAKTGRLTANAMPKVTTPDQTGPRHLRFHPRHKTAYVSNEQGSSVTAYRLDSSTGRLSAFQTLSTLPEGYEGSNTCSHIELTPSGRFVYVANRGHDSLAGFAVDSKDGKLTAIGHFPTEKTPRSFNVAPSGRYLYAAGQASGKLASYRIDDKTGRLRPLETEPVGSRPWWVLVVSTGEKE